MTLAAPFPTRAMPAAAALLGLALATAADAQDAGRIGVAAAFHGQAQEPGQSAADALAISRAALAAGFQMRRLEYPAAPPAPPATRPDVALIYLSGDADGGTVGGWPLAQIAADWQGAAALILAVDTCPAAQADAPVPTLPEPPPRALLVAPADCAAGPRLTEALADALTRPGAEIGAAMRAAGFTVRQGAGWPGFTATQGQARPGATHDSFILDAPQQPVQPVQAPAPAAVAVLAAAPAPQDRMAHPTPPGMPDPSVIVGDLPEDAPEPAPVQPEVAAVIEGQAMDSGFEERERLRTDDAALFTSLLESGAFDPPPQEQVAAIQSELARMGCYAGGIDGEWGPGSRAAVQRYVAAGGGSVPSDEPDPALFRALAARPDVRCPPPAPRPTVAATPQTRTAPAPAAATPRRTAPATTAAPTPQRQPAPPAPAATAPQRRIDPNAIGTGLFR